MCSKIKNKQLTLAILFFVFKKAMIFLSKKDSVFREILNSLPNGFTFSITVKPYGTMASFKKTTNSITTIQAAKNHNLELIFKNPCSAFITFAGIISQHQAFSENRISIKGDIAKALLLTEAINRLQQIIFPDIIVKRLSKEFKGSGIQEKKLLAQFYTIGLIK